MMVGNEGLTRLRASKEYNRVVLPEDDRWSLSRQNGGTGLLYHLLLRQPISLETLLLCSW